MKRVEWLGDSRQAVYVLHAFEKKARRTPKPDIDLARLRFRALMNQRKQK